MNYMFLRWDSKKEELSKVYKEIKSNFYDIKEASEELVSLSSMTDDENFADVLTYLSSGI